MIVLALIMLLAIVLLMIFLISCKNKLKAATRRVSDMRNKEVDIQAQVENVKDEIKSIADLYMASDVLIHLNNENHVYTEIYKTTKMLYNYNQIIMYSFDEENNCFRKEFCYPDSSSFGATIPYAEMRVFEVMNEREISVMINNSEQKPLYYLKLVGRRTAVDGGYMNAVFSQTDITVLNIYLKQSAMVLDKIKAYKKMEKMALTDSLTGLYNRHYAYMRIKEEVKRAVRESYPVSIVFVDIDKFKSINDTFGHDIGDLALKHVSQLLKSVSREYDITIRWGGEEFVLFLPNTPVDGAYVLAERLRQTIEETHFEYCKITASLGISSYPQDNINIEKVIANADSALYHSKQTGRNRVTIYSKVAHLL